MGRNKTYELLDKRQEDHPLLLQRMKSSTLKRKGIRRKTEMSQPGDADELQAEELAAQFSRGQEFSLDEMSMDSVSRTETYTDDSGDSESSMDAAFEYMLNSTQGSGEPLSAELKTLFEESMGTDFSDVRIHTSPASDELSRSIDATAFTVGNDIHFSRGSFDGSSSQGRELIAHELVHTKQQGNTARRKIRRVVSEQDVNKISKQLAVHLFGVGKLKRRNILRTLSAYSAAEITEAWRDTKLHRHLAFFIDSFQKVPDFREYPLELAATFSAMDRSVRVLRISALTSGDITSNQAVRILYLMQGLTTNDLDVAFHLDQELVSPTRFDRFRLALPADETGRLQSVYSRSQAQADVDADTQQQINEKIDEVAHTIYVSFGLDDTIEPGRWRKQEKARRRFNKALANKTITPLQAIEAYQKLKTLTPAELEAFGIKYAQLFSKITENLPVEFLHSPEFGFQTVQRDTEETAKKVSAYHFLYKVGKVYRYLFNNPIPFADINAKQSKVKADAKEMQKAPQLFEHRVEHIRTVQQENLMSLADAVVYLTAGVPTDYVPVDDLPFFDAELGTILLMTGEDPLMGNSDWIYNPGTIDINTEYVLAVLTGLLNKRLKQATGADYLAAKDLLDAQPELARVIISAPMPTQGQSASLADQMENDEGLISVYTQDYGIYLLLSDPTLWTATGDANTRLASALNIAVVGGFGPSLVSFVKGRTIAVDQQNVNAPENETTVRKFGFIGNEFIPVTENWKAKSEEPSGLTPASVNSGAIIVQFLREEIIRQFPDKKEKALQWKPWRVWAFAILHLPKMIDLIAAGIYFMEGYMFPDGKGKLSSGTTYSNLDLVRVQQEMGNQVYGTEFGTANPEDPALLSVEVDEETGYAKFSSPDLPIRRISMQYPDMLFTSGPGNLKALTAELHWPPNSASVEGSTDLKVDLELNDLRYQDAGMLFTLKKIKIEGLHITSDKPIANYTQMNNWYKLFFSVLGFTENVMFILLNGLQVTAQRLAPDMIKDLTDPTRSGDNPEKALSDMLLQKFAEDETLTIKYDSLLVEDMLFNDMGLIRSFGTGAATMEFSNYSIGNNEREMKFGFSGEQLQINGADISSFRAGELGAGTFNLGLYYSEPTAGRTHGRDLMTLSSLAQLSAQTNPTPVSRLKKIEFTLSAMRGGDLSIIGYDMKKLPFSAISGKVEFKDEVPGNQNIQAIPPKVLVTLNYVNGIDFFNLPLPADGGFRLVTTTDSKLRGNLVDTQIELELNSEADQLERGWDIQKMRIIQATIPLLEARHFTMLTQTSEVKLGEGGLIQNVTLKDFEMAPGIKDRDAWDIHSLSLTTGGVDLQGIGVQTAAGISADLQKFTAGSLNFGMVLGQNQMVGDDLHQTMDYSFGASNVSTSGTVSYTSQRDQYAPYDPEWKPTTVSTEINMVNNTIGGTYQDRSVNGETTGSTLTLNADVLMLSIPRLNVSSAEMKVVAPELADHPIVLDNIHAAVSVDFDQFGDATKFSITSLKIGKVSTWGLLITDLKKHKNLVDLPQSVASTINGFFIENLTMEKRAFTEIEILEMKRDKERKSLPNENRTFDFVHNNAGDNRVGFESATFPAGMKLAIGESIGVEMTRATSGKVWFEFVTTNEFTYSITDLDATGLIVKKDNEVMFKGDLDSERTTGGVKIEYIGSGMDARRQTTYTVNTQIPLINIEEFHIKSESLQFDIPETNNQSKFQDIKADVSIVVLEPSFRQQDEILAKSKSLKEQAENTMYSSDKERRDALKAADIKAHSDITINLIKLDIENITAYEAYLKTTGESKIHTNEKKNERYFFNTTQELELQENQAAIIRKLHAENAVFTLTGLEKQHFNLTATNMSVGNDDVRGIEIGTTHYVTSRLKHILGDKESEIAGWDEAGTAASLSVQKITFAGDTDKVYKLTIADPRIYLPQDGDALLNTKGINMIDPWGLIAHINLEDPSHPEIPLFQAGSISIETIETDDGKGGKEYLKKIVIDRPVLSDLVMEGSYQVYDNVENTTLHFDSITFSGKIDGKIVITETKANLAKETGEGKEKNEQPVWNIDAMGADLTIEKAKFTIPVDDISQEGKIRHDKEKGWDVMNEEELRVARNAENQREYDKDKFAFLDASFGTIDLYLFDEKINGYINTIDVPGKTEPQTGYYNLAKAVKSIRELFDDKMSMWTSGEAEYTLDELYCREIDGEYWITTYEGFDYNPIVKILEDTGDGNLVKTGGEEYVRLAAMVNSMMHPQTPAPEGVGIGDIIALLVEIETGYGKYHIDAGTKRQIEEWLNRVEDNLNPTLEMDIEIWESFLRKQNNRGLMQYFNLEENGKIRMHMTAGLSEEANIPALDPNQPNPRSLFPTVTLSPIADPFNPDVPQKGLEIPGFEFRFGENDKLTESTGIKTAKGILKSNGITLESAKFVYGRHVSVYPDRMQHLSPDTLEAKNLKVKGFNLTLYRPPKEEK